MKLFVWNFLVPELLYFYFLFTSTSAAATFFIPRMGILFFTSHYENILLVYLPIALNNFCLPHSSVSAVIVISPASIDLFVFFDYLTIWLFCFYFTSTYKVDIPLPHFTGSAFLCTFRVNRALLVAWWRWSSLVGKCTEQINAMENTNCDEEGDNSKSIGNK